MKHILFALGFAFLSATFSRAQIHATNECSLYVNETPVQHETKMQWFHEAKFGLFIHWGIYSVPAGQWGDKTDYGEWFQLQTHMSAATYSKYAAEFNATNCNAREWIKVAKNAGMKYVVITTKHHDGFCMFDTTNTDYNVVKATPFAHDPIKDLAAACKDNEIKLGFFYSLPDWHHPDIPAQYNQRGFHGDPHTNADYSKYVTYMHNQVKELLSNYGPVCTIWFDGGTPDRKAGRPDVDKADDFVRMIQNLQPDTLINDRLGKGGDYWTPENRIPPGYPDRDFEVCMTLNRHWGYNSADQNWKPAKTVIRNLADIVSKGGNYLLNVGPTADGRFPESAVGILEQVGKWLQVNGDSIYGTTRSPWSDVPPWGRITTKGNRLFVHVFDRPTDGVIRLVGVRSKPSNVALLVQSGQASEITMIQQDDNILIHLPQELPDGMDSVIVLRFNQTPEISGINSGLTK